MRSTRPYGGCDVALCALSQPCDTSRGASSKGRYGVRHQRFCQVGVIGGSGFYELLENAREVTIDTPFGAPSDSYFLGEIGGVPVAFLPRHARGHRILPSEVNYRANIWGMKALGVHYVLSASAVGSLREELKPLDIVVPDQLFDRTKDRPSTFFGDGVVVHMGFADPFCPVLSQGHRRARPQGRRHGARGRHLRLHGGPAVPTRAEAMSTGRWASTSSA